MRVSTTIPASITIDATALAALAPASMPPALADTLADVRALLADCRDRLDAGSKLLLTGDEAAARLSISRRTLQDLEIPSVAIGTCRRWHVADLLHFIETSKTGGLKS
jgi:hypothetical protein